MFFVHLSALLGILVFIFCLRKLGGTPKKLPEYSLTILILAALFVRILCAGLSKGFDNDTACFASWADRMFQVRPSGFYSPDTFTDYPPGYMYVLWLLGAIRNLTGMAYYSLPHLLLLKVPAILCDMGCGLLLYREAKKKFTEYGAFFVAAAYFFNPALILNSSVWGQVDSIFTLLVIIMCLSLIRGKMYPALICFGTGVLIKPHTLLFAPILFAGMLDHILSAEKNARLSLTVRLFFQCLSVGAGMIFLCVPFGLEHVWKQYFSTVTSYPYAAVNAYNFWGFFGLNWVSQDNTFLGIPYSVIGWTCIAAAVAVTLLISLRSRKDREKYPFLGALLMISVFMFSVRMHERYLYPALALLLLAFLYRPCMQFFLCYGGFSVLHFYNTADVLFFYNPVEYDRTSPLIISVSLGMLVCTGLFYHSVFRTYWRTPAEAGGNAPFPRLFPDRPAVKKSSSSRPRAKSGGARGVAAFRSGGSGGSAPERSAAAVPIRRGDFICMALITAIYACFALYDLGDRQAPETAYDMTQGQSIELDFQGQAPVSLAYYIAPWEKRHFTLEGKKENETQWTSFGKITLKNVFTWQTQSLDTGLSHLRLTLEDNQASILEFVFLDQEGNILTPGFAGQYEGLFDESHLYPGTSTYRNSMYFDEIYHGRTAYEFLHGLTSYENTHPPMGKILISLGVALFGMNPFGWRIMGVLFGIAMVPVVYLFARKISENTLLASFASVLFAFDFMHFTQTRIATIDVYITFFVILMYYFMYRYSRLSFYDTPLKKTFLPLGACGVCMGFGIACKWTGAYAGCGLAVIFFSVLYKRYREYVYAGKRPSGSTDGISHRHILDSFLPSTKRTIYFCLVFFVAVPALIYLLSYLPFRDYSDRGLLGRMLYNQTSMFQYHSGLNSTHDFSSPWYEWPILKRPIWYYSRIITKPAEGIGLREGISAFGNPALWWAGIPAAIYMVYLWMKKKDKTAAFLIIGYLAQYLPWFFVTRITFIYHYFPSVVFVVLMILYTFIQWKKMLTRPAFLSLVLLYGTVAVGLFLLFFPVLSGQPVEAEFVDKYLRWFKSWVLTAK